jgi:hypothetical protein
MIWMLMSQCIHKMYLHHVVSRSVEHLICGGCFCRYLIGFKKLRTCLCSRAQLIKSTLSSSYSWKDPSSGTVSLADRITKKLLALVSSILQGRDIEMHPETNGPKIWYPNIHSLEGSSGVVHHRNIHFKHKESKLFMTGNQAGSKCFWYKWTWIHYLGLLRHANRHVFPIQYVEY